MYCTNCGNQIPEEWKFCKFCGAKLDLEDTVQVDLTAQQEMVSESEKTVILEKPSGKKPVPFRWPLIGVLVIALVAVFVLVPRDSVREIPLEMNPLYYDLAKFMGIDFLNEEIEFSSSDQEHAAVYLANCQFIDSDYVIMMEDGSQFQFPMTYKDLYDTGWRLEYEEEKKMLENTVFGEGGNWCRFVREDGKIIYADLVNYEDTPVPLDELKVTQIEPEEFSINGISRGAPVQKIIGQFGLPYGSSYYKWEDGQDDLSFYYINEINYSSLSFYINTETGLLDNICYSVMDPSWWGE